MTKPDELERLDSTSAPIDSCALSGAAATALDDPAVLSELAHIFRDALARPEAA